MLNRLFRPRPAKVAGEALYAALVAQARQTAFYTQLGVADRIDARFELYTLHLVLLLHRLKEQGPQAQETSEVLFETFVSALDDTLRELGVGDLSVPKKMRRLGESLFGRIKSYDEALAALPDQEPLAALIGRTVYSEREDAPAGELAAYVVEAQSSLAALPLEAVLRGETAWPELAR
jgi:cytochrome b pre-mRNA-processing protein 3